MQIRVLCAFLLREILNNADDEIDQVFKDYGSNYRDLYDNIIERKQKQGISRISDIFDEYAGISIEDGVPGARRHKSIQVYTTSQG